MTDHTPILTPEPRKRDEQLLTLELVKERDSLKAALATLRATKNPLAGFCQSEGPHGETICMLPLGHSGECGWEPILSLKHQVELTELERAELAAELRRVRGTPTTEEPRDR